MAEAINVTTYNKALQYDGTNSADLLAVTTGVTLVSESNGVLVLNAYFNYTVNTGDWVIFNPGGIQSVTPGTFFFSYYSEIVPPLELPDMIKAIGVAPIPGISLNGNVTVNVDISPALADVDYAYSVYLVGAHAPLSITSSSIVDENTVSVTVHANLLYVSGAQVVVAAK